jgi:protein-tyrosine-phosphatase
MLGSFLESSEGPREIADPDGGDLATFERTYARIATAVSALAAVIAAVLSA